MDYQKVKQLEKKRSPLLINSHKDLRLKWTKDHMTWNEAWHKVIWSDEKKFNLDCLDGFSFCWRDLLKEEEISTARPQDDDSVMIWTSFG